MCGVCVVFIVWLVECVVCWILGEVVYVCEKVWVGGGFVYVGIGVVGGGCVWWVWRYGWDEGYGVLVEEWVDGKYWWCGEGCGNGIGCWEKVEGWESCWVCNGCEDGEVCKGYISVEVEVDVIKLSCIGCEMCKSWW